MSNKSTTSGGMSAIGLLGVVFVTLKLLGITEVATWSWWWVTAPFWIGLAIAGVIVAGALLIVGIISLIEYMEGRK